MTVLTKAKKSPRSSRKDALRRPRYVVLYISIHKCELRIGKPFSGDVFHPFVTTQDNISTLWSCFCVAYLENFSTVPSLEGAK